MTPRRVYVLLAALAVTVFTAGTAPTTMAAKKSTGAPLSDVGLREAQYEEMRAFPGAAVPNGAFAALRTQASAIAATGGKWHEQTTQPYNAEPAGYTDPVWSNAIPAPGAGFSLVGGRVTAFAADRGTIYAGTADGGVWRLAAGSSAWQPLTDQLATLSIGALAINPADGSLWVGTGEANTNFDSLQGTGVYRMGSDGTFTQVGGNALVSRNLYQLTFDGIGGVYAATNQGLFKTDASGTGAWSVALMPDVTQSFPPYTNHMTTVVVDPNSGGQHVITVDGWRGGSGGSLAFNGIYESTDAGAHFTEVAPTGNLAQSDIGRVSMAYASDGRLYAVVESANLLISGSLSVLRGVFVSSTGTAKGPWKLIADEKTLQNSGSALSEAIGFPVGVQAWYNNVLAVNPIDPNQLYVGLEEVFQTNDGGNTWQVASPYWNFGLACNPNCPNTTHPDQHALAFMNGNLISGNDGGVYMRPTSVTGLGDWTDTNATLHSLQFYDARAGLLNGKNAFWGGMQDNGSGFLQPGAAQMIEPAGGDGFDVIVDPNNANRAVGSYTDLATYITTDGGHSFQTASPSCFGQSIYTTPRADCDNNARFWSPFASDSQNINSWIGGGEFVWITDAGFATRCTTTSCDWKPVFDLGPAAGATAVAKSGGVAWAGYINGSGNPRIGSHDVSVGLATNFGGTWHQINMTGLPKRYIAGVTIDPNNPAHVYAVFNGYNRKWQPDGGDGTVWETQNGGVSWTNMTGNLPDGLGNALVMAGSTLVVATDVGVFTATVGSTAWSRLGSNLPNVSADNIHLAPDGQTVVAGTHGRGIWTFTLGG
ncbi:MAG TPA: hypothetical protein VF160_18260 [Candidatus Dormibacteraeota bacterium]